MSVYAIAQLTITGRATYERYRQRFMPTLQPFGGRLLAADEEPRVLEGRWTGDKVVLLEFPDEARLEAWLRSPEYVRIAVDRKAGAQGPVLLVHGVAAGIAAEAVPT